MFPSVSICHPTPLYHTTAAWIHAQNSIIVQRALLNPVVANIVWPLQRRNRSLLKLFSDYTNLSKWYERTVWSSFTRACSPFFFHTAPKRRPTWPTRPLAFHLTKTFRDPRKRTGGTWSALFYESLCSLNGGTSRTAVAEHTRLTDTSPGLIRPFRWLVPT